MELFAGLLYLAPLAAVLALRALAYKRGVRRPWMQKFEDVKQLLSESQLRTYNNFRSKAVPAGFMVMAVAWLVRYENPDLFFLLMGISATIIASGAVWIEYVISTGRVRLPRPTAKNLT